MSDSGCLYEMMGVDRTASQTDIKKAYHRLALQWHPDRNTAPEAKEKFQALKRIYDVLGDPEKRKVYDRTGSLQDCEDMVQGDTFNELYNAFRAATKVTEDDVASFALKYRGSAEEHNDLLRYYSDFKGDMNRVFDWLMLSRPELDSHRFSEMLEQAIAQGEIRKTKKYAAWSQKVAATPKPTTDPLGPQPNTQKSKRQVDDSQALVAAIKSKGSTFDSMLDKLAAKYSDTQKGSAKGKRKTKSSASDHGKDQQQPDDSSAEPNEEDFQAARARLEHRQLQSKPQGKQTSSKHKAAGADADAAPAAKKQKTADRSKALRKRS